MFKRFSDTMFKLSEDQSGSFTCEPIGIKLDEGESSKWIHAMKPGTYKHKVYGTLKFDMNRLNEFARSVNERVRGIVPDIDYDHKKYSGKAAGWVNEAKVDNAGLWLNVNFTDDAAESIKKGEYKYFSPELAHVWEHPQTGKKIKNVLAGGALTNRPFLKDLSPITLAEEGAGMEELLKALRQHLKLAEDADEEAVTKALNDHFSNLDTNTTVKLAEAELNKSDDGKTVTVTHPNAEGEVKVEFSDDKDDTFAKLREIDPKLAEQMEDQQKQIENLQAAGKMTDVKHQLDEIGGSKVAIAPAVSNELLPVLVRLSDDNRKKVLDAVTKMADGDGIVDLTKHSIDGPPRTEGGDDPVKKLTEKADKLMSENEGMTFGDAITKLSVDEPKLFEEYQNSMEES